MYSNIATFANRLYGWVAIPAKQNRVYKLQTSVNLTRTVGWEYGDYFRISNVSKALDPLCCWFSLFQCCVNCYLPLLSLIYTSMFHAGLQISQKNEVAKELKRERGDRALFLKAWIWSDLCGIPYVKICSPLKFHCKIKGYGKEFGIVLPSLETHSVFEKFRVSRDWRRT